MAKGDLREAADRVSARVAEFYEEMLDAEKTTRAKCTCGRNFDVAVPDWSARAKAIETLLGYGYGRPGLQKDDGADVAAAVSREAGELSPAERQVILLEARRRASGSSSDVA